MIDSQKKPVKSPMETKGLGGKLTMNSKQIVYIPPIQVKSWKEFENLAKESKFVMYELDNFTNCFEEGTKVKTVKVYAFVVDRELPLIIYFQKSWKEFGKPENNEKWDSFVNEINSELLAFVKQIENEFQAVQGKLENPYLSREWVEL